MRNQLITCNIFFILLNIKILTIIFKKNVIVDAKLNNRLKLNNCLTFYM
jgi:hypothetical protein